ncbi:MAG TPA: response regulator [Chloroflexota bacterium]|nr:response regulator [Chloroflexota bacterium]
MAVPRFVLVAEDDSDILELVRDVLEDAGFRVAGAVGADALMEAKRNRPDLILLDYQMPGMDGVTIARELRADRATQGIPIIAMTATGRASAVCREMDADGCLGKPFEIDHLVTAVDRLVHLTH